MQGENKAIWRVIGVVLVAVSAGVIAAIVWLRSGRPASALHLPPGMHAGATSSGTRPAPDCAAQIQALEKAMRDLDKGYSEAMRRYTNARRKAIAATGKDALAKELADAQRELSDAIENHPRIVALKQQMAQAETQANAAYSNQAVLLTQLGTAKVRRETTFKTTANDIMTRQDAERRKAILEPSGKKDFTKLTPEETAKLEEIQKKYFGQLRDVRLQFEDREAHPDEQEKALVAEYKTLAEQRDANNKRYGEIYDSLSNERARLQVDDPAIAALALKVTDLSARRNAALAGSTDLAPLQRELEYLKKQQADIALRLTLLRRQAAGVPANGHASFAEKHG